MLCIANGITDIGMIREENQDSILVEEKLGIFAVADGMGGMLKGALASKFTLEGLRKLFKARTIPIIDYSDYSDCQKKIVLLLKGFIAKLSDLLREELGPEAGSTLAMALAKGESIYNPKKALKDLVDKANGAGGKDNITAVIVDCFQVCRY